MNFLADESVDRAIVERLRQDGHTVEYVAELSPGISDDEMLGRSSAATAVLLTSDKDFGELVFRLGRAHTGVMLLRLAGEPTAERVEIVSGVVRDHGAELPGAFAVVTKDAIRIRPGPSAAGSP